MPIIKLKGYTIKLPFTPYEAQTKSMETLLSSFETGESALIESPTGTGKSISILCAALAYLEEEKNKILEDTSKKSKLDSLNDFSKQNLTVDQALLNALNGSIDGKENRENKNKLPKIFICSRTHKQLDQLVEQLRQTNYTPKITILGSRHQYCINTKAKKAADINTACKDLTKSSSCIHRRGVGRLKAKLSDLFDIEEMKELGRKCAGCPYYTAREMVEDAEIIFAPYNYILDPKIRSSMNISLTNNILIIDEAHNVEDTCRSAGSLEFDTKNIDYWYSELLTAARKVELLENGKEERKHFLSIAEFIKKFRVNTDVFKCTESNYEFSYQVYKGEKIRTELEKIEVNNDTFLIFESSLNALNRREEAKSILSQTLSQSLGRLQFVLKTIFNLSVKDYVLCLKKYKKNQNLFGYSFWLMDGGLIFKQVTKEAKSIALLSGTLSPLNSLCGELGHKFTQQIIAPHILTENQTFIANIQKGHLKNELTGTYNISLTATYLDQIAKIIKDIAEMTMSFGGTIVFLPSYSFLNKLNDKMKIKTILEPNTGGNEQFEKILNIYKKVLKNKAEPAVLFCVYRGKASEGIDFKDDYARAVVAVGIPYPSIKDPQIQSKKEYNDKSIGNTLHNGSQWYMTQAMRAVNQALGRVVRHPKDWGSVFMLETRYKQMNTRKQLPQWVREGVKDFDTFEESRKEYTAFLQKQAESKFQFKK